MLIHSYNHLVYKVTAGRNKLALLSANDLRLTTANVLLDNS